MGCIPSKLTTEMSHKTCSGGEIGNTGQNKTEKIAGKLTKATVYRVGCSNYKVEVFSENQ
jgi:hypothetical protein